MPSSPVTPSLATPRDLRRDRSILALAAALCGALGAAGLAALAVSAQLSNDHHDRAMADATSSLNAATELLEQTRGELLEERKALDAARAEVRATGSAGAKAERHDDRARTKHRRGKGHRRHHAHRDHEKHPSHPSHPNHHGHQARDQGSPTPSGQPTLALSGGPEDLERSFISDLSKVAETAIRCETEDHCQIDADAIEAAAKSQPAEGTPSARFIPSIRDGERLGTKVYGIRSGSTMKLLGFRNGDNIKSVDIKGPTLGDSGSATPVRATLSIELERKGEPVRKQIDVV